jgi:hypothetical protein
MFRHQRGWRAVGECTLGILTLAVADGGMCKVSFNFVAKAIIGANEGERSFGQVSLFFSFFVQQRCFLFDFVACASKVVLG